MPSHRVGFVGFGEVASVLSRALRERETDVFAYDINLTRPGGRPLLEKRVKASGIGFCLLPELVGNVELVLSTVRPQTAVDAARECAPLLRSGQTFVDLNSTSPSVKLEIGRIIRGSRAEFVEGAILGAVGATGASTRILTGGEGGESAAATLTRQGLNACFFSAELGKASLFKMLRSIFSKGVEALLLELFVSARKAGLQEALWEDLIRDFMTRNPFERVASTWIQTHPAACERRHHEITQVLETMRELGVEPLASEGTEAFFRRSVSMGLKQALPEKAPTVESVIDLLERKLGEKR